jgi:Sugar (and other) transporter
MLVGISVRSCLFAPRILQQKQLKLIILYYLGVPNMPQTVITNCNIEHTGGGLPPCLPMTDYVWGLTVGLYAIGGLIGSLSTMFTNMWFGRRSNIMLCTIFTMVGGIFSALAINTGMVSFNLSLS